MKTNTSSRYSAAYFFIAALVIATWIAFWNVPMAQGFSDRMSALGVLFTGLALIGLLFTMVRDSTSRSEMADAITKIEEQNRLQLEMLYLQSITSEMEGIRLLKEQFQSQFTHEQLKDLLNKCRAEFFFSKERARERLGIKPGDI